MPATKCCSVAPGLVGVDGVRVALAGLARPPGRGISSVRSGSLMTVRSSALTLRSLGWRRSARRVLSVGRWSLNLDEAGLAHETLTHRIVVEAAGHPGEEIAPADALGGGALGDHLADRTDVVDQHP